MTIKGLSLWQPWASLMVVGAKRIETRSWSTNYRGLVAIHAAKKWDSDLKEWAMITRFWNQLSKNHRSISELPRGCFVALGRLHRCLSTNDYPEAIPAEGTDEHEFGDYSPERYMWVFDEIWKLKQPVFTAGHQGLWTLDEGEADVVLAMLPDGVEDQLEEKCAR